ncbi:MAG: bifunctional adenosylcobinamide kinase/adenosylcobinamide-phosphate guanylyltransferase [Deltaproteobacteria bacterium]|nr:bifunctional adenosylcobinamide kinase/adenosylcobinamide-phosphate guanylyltransferase [Deltaproteobacteria bacterium]
MIFVTGGARSGKSAFALETANQVVGAGVNRGLSLFTGEAERSRRIGTVSGMNKKCYLATAQALDSEMEDRIAKHRAERGDDWDCIEEPLNVASMLREISGKYDVVLFDCLTLWISNLMLKDQESGVRSQESEVEGLIASCKTTNATTIVVSNEVGLGTVPDNALARKFRDVAGTANRLFAKAADEVYFVVSGIPMRLK